MNTYHGKRRLGHVDFVAAPSGVMVGVPFMGLAAGAMVGLTTSHAGYTPLVESRNVTARGDEYELVVRLLGEAARHRRDQGVSLLVTCWPLVCCWRLPASVRRWRWRRMS